MFCFQVPICMDAKFQQRAWDNLFRDHIMPYCQKKQINPFLVEFARDKEYLRTLPDRKKYQAAIKEFRKWFAQYGFPVGGWNRAECMTNSSLESLHGEMRFSGHTIKWIMLMALEYYQWISDPDNVDFVQSNHHGQYTFLAEDVILYHFREHCQCDFTYDPKNPGSMRVQDS